MKNNLLVLAGAVAGGVLGHFIFVWLMHQGFYAMIVPGGLVGLGAGMFKCRPLAIPIVCGVMALAAGLISRWSVGLEDNFGQFLAHLTDLQPFTLIMLAIGTFLGFWVPFRRGQDARKSA